MTFFVIPHLKIVDSSRYYKLIQARFQDNIYKYKTIALLTVFDFFELMSNTYGQILRYVLLGIIIHRIICLYCK